MIECSELRKKFDLFLDGLIEPTDRKKLEEHFSRCKACSSEIEKIKAFDVKASSVARVPMPVSLNGKILEFVKPKTTKKVTANSQEDFISKFFERLISFWKPVFALAGIILALFLGSPFSDDSTAKHDRNFLAARVKLVKGNLQIFREGKLLRFDKNPADNEINVQIQSKDKIVVLADCESEINFPGLTLMKLLSDTEIEWLQNGFFIHKGRAALNFPKLDVPFIIKTPQLEFEITGTELGFNISDGKTRVYLVSGSIRIKEGEIFTPVKAGSMVYAEIGKKLSVTPIPEKKGLKELLKASEVDVKPDDSGSW